MSADLNQTDNYARALKQKKKQGKYNKSNLGQQVNLPENLNKAEEEPDQEQVKSPEKKGLRDRALEYKKTLDQQRRAARKLQGVKNLTFKEKTVGLRVKRLQRMYRFINGTLAVTPFGIFLLILTMNAQLILGNFFNIKTVPKLELWEIGLLLLVDGMVIFVILIFLLIISFFSGAGFVEGLRHGSGKTPYGF